MAIRDYTIHLKVRVPDGADIERLDEDVENVVDASSAREAIQTGLDYSRSYQVGDDGIELLNFYVVSPTRPEGGIEGE